MTTRPKAPTAPSPRIRAAVALFAPRPGERLLEIGCGTGQGIEVALAAAPGATVAAIDRSETAVARARVVNAVAIAAGRASVAVGDIERGPVTPGLGGPGAAGGFDRAYAVRVNSFWTRPGPALRHAVESLRPDGELWLIYDGPADKVIGPILASFRDFGLAGIRTKSADGAFALVAARPTSAG